MEYYTQKSLLPKNISSIAEVYGKLHTSISTPTQPYSQNTEVIFCPDYEHCPISETKQCWTGFRSFTWLEMLMHLWRFHPNIANCEHIELTEHTGVSNCVYYQEYTCKNCGMPIITEKSRTEVVWNK